MVNFSAALILISLQSLLFYLNTHNHISLIITSLLLMVILSRNLDLPTWLPYFVALYYYIHFSLASVISNKQQKLTQRRLLLVLSADCSSWNEYPTTRRVQWTCEISIFLECKAKVSKSKGLRGKAWQFYLIKSLSSSWLNNDSPPATDDSGKSGGISFVLMHSMRHGMLGFGMHGRGEARPETDR